MTGSDRKQRRRLLRRVVSDADALLSRAGSVNAGLDPGDKHSRKLTQASSLLLKIMLQDIERAPDREPGAKEPDRDLPDIARGGRNRLLSLSDPDMRHGRKSSANGFAGHKASVITDTDTGLITAVAVLPGNSPDAEGALDLVRESEANASVTAEPGHRRLRLWRRADPSGVL